MPAIEAYEVGGVFFVSDGHHRVALARERGADYIDAEVTRLETNYEIGPDVDVRHITGLAGIAQDAESARGIVAQQTDSVTS